MAATIAGQEIRVLFVKTRPGGMMKLSTGETAGHFPAALYKRLIDRLVKRLRRVGYRGGISRSDH